MNASERRIFIIDGMRYLVQKLPGQVQVTTTESVQSTINLHERGERFSLVITDITLPGMDGFPLL